MEAIIFNALPASLQQICNELLEGKGDLKGLKDGIEETRENLLKMRDDFTQVISRIPFETQEVCRESILLAEQSFEEYLDALERVEQYLNTSDLLLLKSGKEMLGLASNSLEEALFHVRQARLLAMGPTQVPGINLLIDTANRLSAGEEIEDLFRDQIDIEKAAIQEMINQLEQEVSPYGVQELINSYDLYLEGVEMLGEYLETRNLELLRKGISTLVNASQFLADATTASDLRRLTFLPTASPHANLVINLARDLLAGQTDTRAFWKALAAFKDDLEKIKFYYETNLSPTVTSSEVEEEREKVAPLIEKYEGVIMSLYSFLEGKDTTLLEPACRKIQELTGEMEELWKKFEESAEREVKVKCIRCGHYSSRGRRTCEKCFTNLPPVEEEHPGISIGESGVIEQSRETREVKMTENIHILFDSARQVSEGQISNEEFSKIVNWMENLVQEAQKLSFPPPHVTPKKEEEDLSTIRETLEEAAHQYGEGLQDILTGLLFFRQFISGGDKENLQSGIQVIWQGVGKLQKVQEITHFK